MHRILLCICVLLCLEHAANSGGVLKPDGSQIDAISIAEDGKRLCGNVTADSGICSEKGHLISRFPGILTPIPEGLDCKDPCEGKDDVTGEECDFHCGPRDPPKSTKMDMRDFFLKQIIPWPWPWICDDPSKRCCQTCIAKIPFRRCYPFGIPLYVVWCPLYGGYQWYNVVRCPRNKKCKKRCKKEYSCRSYLVTHIKPNPVWGHCFNIWLPAWFQTFWVENHCVCPRKSWIDV